MLKNVNEYDSHVRLIARIVRTLLTSEPFDSLSDLTEALKCRCTRMRIPWTNDDISAAYALIASNTPMPGTPMPRHTVPIEHGSDLVISRAEAAAIYGGLLAKHQAARIRTMPSVTPDQDETRVRQQADILRHVRRPVMERLMAIFGDHQ